MTQRKAAAWHHVLTSAAILLASSPSHAESLSDATQALIERALSAAPKEIAAGATVIGRDDKGAKTVLRQGNNGWTCFPTGHSDPDPLPSCFDENGLAFIHAFGSSQPPDPAKPGYSYMLRGGSGWSNIDPMAEKLPADQTDFIHIPPHIMILNAKMANESGLPLHEKSPDTHRPFVMFGGTPYAILIVPVQ